MRGRCALAGAATLVVVLVVAGACRRDDPVASAVATLLASAAAKDDTDATVDALAAFGAPAVPALVAALGDPKEGVRLVAVAALGKIRGDAAVAALVGALGDRSENVRLEVVRALGELRARQAVAPLMERYRTDDDDQVRYDCLTSLGAIGDPAAVDLLVAETASRDQYVRMWALDALCTMGDAHAPPLAVTLLRDPSPNVREQVVRGCARAFDTADGRRALVEFALASPEFQATVIARRDLAGYVQAHGEGVADEIRTAARAELDGPRGIRAALLLGDLADPAATDRLIQAIADPDPWVRHHAAFLLARIGDARAVPALIGALGDGVELVAVTAYTSLQVFADRGDERATQALAGYKGRRPTERVAH